MHDFTGQPDRPGAARASRSRCSASTASPRPASTSAWSSTSAAPGSSPASALTRLKAESLARRSGKRVSLEDIFGSGLQELNLVLKADVAGSLEAIEDEIAKLPQDEVSVNVIRRAVGARHRVRRDARRRLRRGDPRRSTCARSATRARRPSARASRSATTRSSTARSRSCARDAGHARARGGRGDARHGRGAPALPRLAGRHDRRLARHRRQDHPRLEGAAGPRRHRRLRRRDREPAALQRRRARGRQPASTAGSCCATTPTSRKATCSRPTRRARSSASSPESGRPVPRRLCRRAGDRAPLPRCRAA